MLNQIIIMGRLAADPVIRYTSAGIPVANIRIACDRDRTADSQEKICDFFDVVAWRKTAEFAQKYFMKGKPILVTGRLQSRNWQDQTGAKRTSIEILADRVDFCGGDRVQNAAAPAAPAAPAGGMTQAALDSIFDDPTADDEDLPWLQ